MKTLKPDVKVYGVEPYFAASYTAALEAQTPVATKVTPTLADGLAVPMVGSHAFEVARHYVDECVLCNEKEVSLAILRLIENEKMVVEGKKYNNIFVHIYDYHTLTVGFDDTMKVEVQQGWQHYFREHN